MSPANNFRWHMSTQRGHFSFIPPEIILVFLTQRQQQDSPSSISQCFSWTHFTVNILQAALSSSGFAFWQLDLLAGSTPAAWSRQSFSYILHISFWYFSAWLVITFENPFDSSWIEASVCASCTAELNASAGLKEERWQHLSTFLTGHQREEEERTSDKEAEEQLQKPWRSSSDTRAKSISAIGPKQTAAPCLGMVLLRRDLAGVTRGKVTGERTQVHWVPGGF